MLGEYMSTGVPGVSRSFEHMIHKNKEPRDKGTASKPLFTRLDGIKSVELSEQYY
jgi:hypothetical protein